MTETEITDNLIPLAEYLDKLNRWVDEVPPVEQPMRFGNKAFKTWLERIITNADTDIPALSTIPNFHLALPEITHYLVESFGSYMRIDYGTGHELNFVLFLFCLFKLQVVGPQDFKALINIVFQKYMNLMRKVQLTYLLEPAGSHGVWGLDDYQHLAFYFGAS